MMRTDAVSFTVDRRHEAAMNSDTISLPANWLTVDYHTVASDRATGGDEVPPPLFTHGPRHEVDSTTDNAQPDQRRRPSDSDLTLLEQQQQQQGGGGAGGVMDTTHDNATIYTQRTGTDTLDTDKTLQRGSLSKKPSPDDHFVLKPYKKPRKGSLGAGRGQQQRDNSHGDLTHSTNSQEQPQILLILDDNGQTKTQDVPSTLSFPSPPSMEDQEWPTRETSSGKSSTEHEEDPRQPRLQLERDNSSSTISSAKLTQESNSHNYNNGGSQNGSSRSYGNNNNRRSLDAADATKQKRWVYTGVAVFLVILVLAVVLATSLPKKGSKNNQQNGPDEIFNDGGESSVMPPPLPSPSDHNDTPLMTAAPSPEPTTTTTTALSPMVSPGSAQTGDDSPEALLANDDDSNEANAANATLPIMPLSGGVSREDPSNATEEDKGGNATDVDDGPTQAPNVRRRRLRATP